MADPRPSRDYNTQTGAGELPVPHFKYDNNSCNPKTLIFRGLADKIDAEALRLECAKFGTVEDVQIVKHPRTGQPLGVGTVRFEDHKMARTAKIGLNNCVRYGKKISALWDADGNGGAREISDLVAKENASNEQPKSWSVVMPAMDDFNTEADITPGAWMNQFKMGEKDPGPGLLPIPGMPITTHTVHSTYTHIKEVKMTVQDFAYDPSSAFEQPPPPPEPTIHALVPITIPTNPPPVSPTAAAAATDLGDDLTDEQMDMEMEMDTSSPVHPTSKPADYDPLRPTDPTSPISTEWYYMQSAQHHQVPPGYPYPPMPYNPHAHAQAAAHHAAAAAAAHAYNPHYPPMPHPAYPPPISVPHVPPPLAVPYTFPVPAAPVATALRRSPHPTAFALQIARLSVQNDTFAVPLREHFKAFNPTDVYHDNQMWYVDFRDQATLERALRVLNGSVFQGWKINLAIHVRTTPKVVRLPADAAKSTDVVANRNKPKEAIAVAIVMADLLRNALHDAQRAVIDTAIKEMLANRLPVSARTAAPAGSTLKLDTEITSSGPVLDIQSLPSFKNKKAVDETPREPRVRRPRKPVAKPESESEESSSGEEVGISSSDEEPVLEVEAEEEEDTRKKPNKRKDYNPEDMIPYKGILLAIYLLVY